MSLAGVTSTLWTVWPLMSRPRMACALALASSAVSASLTPPALPRPPVLTCALTTTVWPNPAAAAAASSGVCATSPGNTGTPCSANSCFAWYSYRSKTVSPRDPSQTARTLTLASRLADVFPDPGDDLLGGGAGGEHLGDVQLGELGQVIVGDDPAAEHDDVVGALAPEQLDHLGEQRHVRAGEHRQPDGVGVLLQRGLHDLLRGLVQARVDDLHAGIPQCPGHDLGSAVVAVKSRLCDDHADSTAHGSSWHLVCWRRDGWPVGRSSLAVEERTWSASRVRALARLAARPRTPRPPGRARRPRRTRCRPRPIPAPRPGHPAAAP